MPHLLLGKVFTAPLPLEKKKKFFYSSVRGAAADRPASLAAPPRTPSVAAVMFWAATLVKGQKKKLPQASLCTHSNLNLKFQSVYARNRQNETPKLSHNWNLSSHTHTHTHTHATPPSPPSLYSHPSPSSPSPSQASLWLPSRQNAPEPKACSFSFPSLAGGSPHRPALLRRHPPPGARSLSPRHIHLPSPALSHTINSHAH